MNIFDSIAHVVSEFEVIAVRVILCVGTIILLIQFIKSKLKK
jgi:hypothetical protein